MNPLICKNNDKFVKRFKDFDLPNKNRYITHISSQYDKKENIKGANPMLFSIFTPLFGYVYIPISKKIYKALQHMVDMKLSFNILNLNSEDLNNEVLGKRIYKGFKDSNTFLSFIFWIDYINKYIKSDFSMIDNIVPNIITSLEISFRKSPNSKRIKFYNIEEFLNYVIKVKYIGSKGKPKFMGYFLCGFRNSTLQDYESYEPMYSDTFKYFITTYNKHCDKFLIRLDDYLFIEVDPINLIKYERLDFKTNVIFKEGKERYKSDSIQQKFRLSKLNFNLLLYVYMNSNRKRYAVLNKKDINKLKIKNVITGINNEVQIKNKEEIKNIIESIFPKLKSVNCIYNNSD